MKKSARTVYIAEREDAINTLTIHVHRFRETLNAWAKYADYIDNESASVLQAYTQAQLALLQLMKEKREDQV